jgi:hypothetical protein
MAMKSVVSVDIVDHGYSKDHKPRLLGGEEGALVG